jgi:hypothetical protein
VEPTKGVPSTWATVEWPILTTAVRAAQKGESADLGALQEELGMAWGAFQAVVRRLETANYIGCYWQGGGGGSITHVHERALRETGAWPGPGAAVDQLVAAMNRAAEDAPDDDRRSRFRQVADGLGGVARDLAVDVLAKVIAG